MDIKSARGRLRLARGDYKKSKTDRNTTALKKAFTDYKKALKKMVALKKMKPKVKAEADKIERIRHDGMTSKDIDDFKKSLSVRKPRKGSTRIKILSKDEMDDRRDKRGFIIKERNKIFKAKAEAKKPEIVFKERRLMKAKRSLQGS